MRATHLTLSVLALGLSGLTCAAERPAQGAQIGLADSAALRATVYGTRPGDLAPLPAQVPLAEIIIALPGARPVPEVFWFDRRLRAWFTEQDHPAPLVIVVSGTGADGNTSKISTLRAALFGAGYHVLTLPSPTFPGFIVAASSTGVGGDLRQDSEDLYSVAHKIIARLPRRVRITDTHVIGYSLGGANAAVMKSIDARTRELQIHRVVMINPPVSLFASIGRIDRLYAQSIGSSDAGLENLYRKLYARLANHYRAAETVHLEAADVFAAAGSILQSDADYAAVIALTFRLALVDVFFAGDVYAGTGAVVDARHLPGPGDSLEQIGARLRSQPFAQYFARVFAPYYLAHRPGSTRDSLYADSNLAIIGGTLHTDADYYAQTNRDELILDAAELRWLTDTLGTRIAVYDHGGHLGNLGDRQQIADMLAMLAGAWRSGGN